MKIKKRIYRLLKQSLKLVGLLFLLAVLLILFIRSPWGQGIIVEKLVSFVTEKTGTNFSVDKLFITFSGDVEIQGLYLEDLQKDTLLYSRNLQAEVAISPLIFGNTLNINDLEWSGVVVNVNRPNQTEKFNFSFLQDAFITPEPRLTEDTTEEISVDIGSVSLTEFEVNYIDAFLGISSKNTIGSLYTQFETINIKELLFHVNQLELTNSSISYVQNKPLPNGNENASSTLPELAFSKIALENVTTYYHSVRDGTLADITLGQLSLGLPKIDLDSNSYEIDGFSLQNSKVLLELPQETENSLEELSLSTSTEFVWPKYTIDATNLSLKNNQFSFLNKAIDTVQNKFNPNNLDFSEIGFSAKTVSYSPQKVNLDVEELIFKEKSGLHLNQLTLKADLNENEIRLSDLVFKTSRSSLNGTATFNYSSVQSLIDSPKNVLVDLNIPFFTFDTKDLYIFKPALKTNEVVQTISTDTLKGQLFAKGTLDEITLTNTTVNWGSQTSLKVAGTVFNSTSIDSLRVDFDSIIATTGKSDLNQFTALKGSTVTFPQQLKLSSTASGSLKNLNTDIKLSSSMGNVHFKGSSGFTNVPFIEGLLTVDSLQLGSLLNNPQFKDLSLTVDANLKGKNLKTLAGNLKANISELYWNGYLFADLSANANIDEGTGKISLDYKDKNLNLTSLTALKLDSTRYNIETSIDLIGANLNALAITQNDIRVGANIYASFLGTTEEYTIKGKITEGVSVIDNDQFQTGDIDISASVSKNTTEANMNSDFLNGGVKANSSPDQISKALLIQFENYFTDDAESISQPDSILVYVNANITPKPILTEVFFRGIDRLDIITMNASFDSAKRNLHAKLHLPYAEYNGSTVDSLNLMINGDANDLKFSFGMNSLRYNPLFIKKTYFNGVLNNKKLELDFISFDANEKLAHIASEMEFRSDTLTFRIDPEKLLLNKKQWTIPENNQITYAKDYLGFSNVVFSRNNQELELSESLPDVKSNHIGLRFKNFALQTFLSLLNPDKSLSTGIVDGNLIVENPFDAAGILAEININNFGILENRLGNLSLNAFSQELSKYSVDLALKDGAVDMDLTGSYKATSNGPSLNLYLDLKKLETAVVTGFFSEELKNPTGFLTGQLELQGTLKNPIYDGNISFNNTSLDFSALNTSFKVDKESVEIDETSIALNTFEIEDAKGSSFTIDGKINTKNILNPSFDLNFKTEKFGLLNSTAKDNALYYGTASIDADVKFKGNLNLPKLTGMVRLRDVTEFTYVVPEEQLDIEERDGVVIFVNRENLDAILTNNQENDTPPLFLGLDANLIIEIAEKALFTLVLDEKTDDVLQVAGDAALNLNLNPNGIVGLTGRYELANGYYRTSLYNLVSRKFDMKPGSTIIWQGDPLDAKLDVTAIYSLETSAAPLMASETSGVESGLASKYQQVMPFLVYLNVDGEITAPEISFNLGIPENAQGELGGVVYGKVQQLNAQEAELNKQVFSLLALNRFFPNTVSDGSSGGAASLARNNVNKVLSSELNTFSDKVLGNSGFELDFDLDSFTDYTGENAQDRTQLNINASKKLFNDRLIVTAGSAIDVEGSAQLGQEESPIIGNVSLEYLLTQNGRYRLKGYRKSEYTNVIDGQLIVTGLALIFNREFNKFSELFNPIEQNMSSPQEKLDNKNDIPNVKKSKNEE